MCVSDVTLPSRLIQIISAVSGSNKEVISGTAVTISCVVTDINRAVTTVWKTSGQTNLNSVTGYAVVQGSFDSSGRTQTTTLALTGAVNNEDKVYTCDVTPEGGSVKSTQVNLNVFGELNPVINIVSELRRC